MASLWKFFVVSILLIGIAGAVQAKEVKFAKDKIKVGGKTIPVEVAASEAEHSQGLMYRKSLPENEGMLFIFADEDIRYFWMKNTYIDLSIAYFDKKKTIVDIQEMAATSVMEVSRPPTYPSAKPAMYALEMNKGWFAKNKVKVGEKFEFIKR
jgi:uncharacterized membrane protein (UPF0127 family)